ncbi:MAG: DNA mismatch repair endonuclease MutL [Chloroflexota bacterium]
MIRRLAPEVADAIAAGEVVERPASVVKELVENALDAGARRVSVEVRGAGRTLVRVADDGAGIAPEELPLAFLRHATSKVEHLADLGAIGTLGFRGEALASMAAVAEVECRSRGAAIRLRAGEVLESGGAAPTAGTVVEVRDLFANTPARLKFLKSEATETAAAAQVVRAYALLRPDVRFELVMDGRKLLAAAGDGDRRAAAAGVLGGQVAEAMLVLEAEGLAGMVSEPRLSRGTRDASVLAVNARPVSSHRLQHALEQAYLGRLERGRYPVAIVDLAVPLQEVDVNVHPAKREVRFRDEGALYGRVQRAVLAALGGSRPFALSLPAVAEAGAAPGRQLTLHEPAVALAPAAGPEWSPKAMPLRALGQVMDGYLVAEGPDGLVLVDQHAAHERILYNRFLARLRGAPAPSQTLLLPLMVDLDAGQVVTAADHRDRLLAIGFDLEDFGPRTARVLAAPVETAPERIEEALVDLLSALGGARSDDRLEKAAASVACHSAVRFGDPMDIDQQRWLLEELERADDSITCPHGRPTRLELSTSDLRRHFRRNY